VTRLGLILPLLALLVALVATPAAAAAPAASEPKPKTPIEHFLFLMQENHSFDNYFGTYPGADGIPAGTCMPRNPTSKADKECVKSFRLGDRAVVDLAHNEETHMAQYRNGRMDGFVWAFGREGKRHGSISMGYYDDKDIPYYWNVADEYVLFDRFFSSAHGGSVINHMYWATGAPGIKGKRDAVPAEGWGDLPTIFDRLEEKGISWKFYVQNYDPKITFRTAHDSDRAAQVVWVPLLGYARYVDDPELSKHIVDLDEYYADLKRGTLPSVAYIVPSGASEHPPGSIKAGQRFVRTLITELMSSRYWDSSAFMWSYDDWGGWYDHVKPPKVDERGYGFRVPTLLVSAWAKRGHVESTALDFASVPKFIEENWDLRPLATRDAKSNSFMSAFDFTNGPRQAVFLNTVRNPTTLAEPKRGVIYMAYAAALAIPAALIGIAFLRMRRLAGAPA
jgi:phospholipase C